MRVLSFALNKYAFINTAWDWIADHVLTFPSVASHRARRCVISCTISPPETRMQRSQPKECSHRPQRSPPEFSWVTDLGINVHAEKFVINVWIFTFCPPQNINNVFASLPWRSVWGTYDPTRWTSLEHYKTGRLAVFEKKNGKKAPSHFLCAPVALEQEKLSTLSQASNTESGLGPTEFFGSNHIQFASIRDNCLLKHCRL